jgi:ATP-binding cassette subfamily F protein 3
MISVEELYVDFGGFELFKQVSFIVNPRDRIGLAGRNGAGKSTLLKIFAGLQLPSGGRVVVPKGVKIGYLPQQMETRDTRTVMEEAVSAFSEIKEMEHRIEFLNQELANRTDYESTEYHNIIDEVHELNERFQLMGGTNFHVDIVQTLTGLGFEERDFDRLTSEFSGGWRMFLILKRFHQYLHRGQGRLHLMAGV